MPSVHALVRDDALLPDMYRRGLSNAAIQELAPSPLFRVVLDAKFAEGPVFVLYFELFLFLVLGCCFTRVAAFEVLGVSKWFAAEMIAEIVAAFVILSWFSARKLYQIWSTRAIELTTPEDLISDKKYNAARRRLEPEAQGLAYYALLIPRFLVGFVVCLPLLPILLVYFGLQWAGKRYAWMTVFRKWFYETILIPIRHDPLTFLGLSRSWRGDYWNIIDALTLSCAWAALVRAAAPGFRMGIDLAAMTWVLLWLNLFGFVRQLDQRLATFVMMFERIVRDIWVFLLFYMMWVFMFACVFYLRLGPAYDGEFGFHDDGPRPGSFVPRLIARPLISTQARRTRSSPCGSRSSRCCCSASRATSTPTTTLRTWTRPCSSRTSSSPSLFS